MREVAPSFGAATPTTPTALEQAPQTSSLSGRSGTRVREAAALDAAIVDALALAIASMNGQNQQRAFLLNVARDAPRVSKEAVASRLGVERSSLYSSGARVYMDVSTDSHLAPTGYAVDRTNKEVEKAAVAFILENCDVIPRHSNRDASVKEETVLYTSVSELFRRFAVIRSRLFEPSEPVSLTNQLRPVVIMPDGDVQWPSFVPSHERLSRSRFFKLVPGHVVRITKPEHCSCPKCRDGHAHAEQLRDLEQVHTDSCAACRTGGEKGACDGWKEYAAALGTDFANLQQKVAAYREHQVVVRKQRAKFEAERVDENVCVVVVDYSGYSSAVSACLLCGHFFIALPTFFLFAGCSKDVRRRGNGDAVLTRCCLHKESQF
jgi:hypothetical protein